MKTVLIICLCLISCQIMAQAIEAKLYNPLANAEKDIADAVKKAKAERKYVFIQAGGNWCAWCLEFNSFCHSDKQIDSMLTSDFIVYHLNYSQENKNSAIMVRYGFPQRFGFPVFLVLDENGNRIHTQNSVYLEQGKSYNKRKVIEFLQQWNRVALNPGTYKKF